MSKSKFELKFSKSPTTYLHEVYPLLLYFHAPFYSFLVCHSLFLTYTAAKRIFSYLFAQNVRVRSVSYTPTYNLCSFMQVP